MASEGEAVGNVKGVGNRDPDVPRCLWSAILVFSQVLDGDNDVVEAADQSVGYIGTRALLQDNQEDDVVAHMAFAEELLFRGGVVGEEGCDVKHDLLFCRRVVVMDGSCFGIVGERAGEVAARGVESTCVAREPREAHLVCDGIHKGGERVPHFCIGKNLVLVRLPRVDGEDSDLEHRLELAGEDGSVGGEKVICGLGGCQPGFGARDEDEVWCEDVCEGADCDCAGREERGGVEGEAGGVEVGCGVAVFGGEDGKDGCSGGRDADGDDGRSRVGEAAGKGGQGGASRSKEGVDEVEGREGEGVAVERRVVRVGRVRRLENPVRDGEDEGRRGGGGRRGGRERRVVGRSVGLPLDKGSVLIGRCGGGGGRGGGGGEPCLGLGRDRREEGGCRCKQSFLAALVVGHVCYVCVEGWGGGVGGLERCVGHCHVCHVTVGGCHWLGLEGWKVGWLVWNNGSI